ncbi:unnamed protein product [Arctogadus glacialis]
MWKKREDGETGRLLLLLLMLVVVVSVVLMLLVARASSSLMSVCAIINQGGKILKQEVPAVKVTRRPVTYSFDQIGVKGHPLRVSKRYQCHLQ